MNIQTPEFLLWSQVIFLWAVAAYGINSDPLPEDATSKTFPWAKWKAAAIVRTIFLFGTTFLISESVNLSLWVLLIAIGQPWFRYKLPNRWDGRDRDWNSIHQPCWHSDFHSPRPALGTERNSRFAHPGASLSNLYHRDHHVIRCQGWYIYCARLPE